MLACEIPELFSSSHITTGSFSSTIADHTWTRRKVCFIHIVSTSKPIPAFHVGQKVFDSHFLDKTSRIFHHFVRNLGHPERCFSVLGRAAEWKRTVQWKEEATQEQWSFVKRRAQTATRSWRRRRKRSYPSTGNLSSHFFVLGLLISVCSYSFGAGREIF